MNISLPLEYTQYIEANGQFEGFTSGEPGYVQLWKIEDLPTINSEIFIGERAPGFLAFASDGGNEVLAFDSNGAVHKLPMIGMDVKEAIKIASSFSELLSRFGTRISKAETRP